MESRSEVGSGTGEGSRRRLAARRCFDGQIADEPHEWRSVLATINSFIRHPAIHCVRPSVSPRRRVCVGPDREAV